ncbi:MAG: CsiV family protein [Methylophaga sp.]|nr:CsiV family protein [Methylophaga sp.]
MVISKRLSILLFTGLLLSMPAHAQQWYQVELVVFEQLNPATDEQWPVMPPMDPSAVTPKTANGKIQPANRESLAGVAERLRNSANYRVLSYHSWQQSVLNKNASLKVAIEGERLSGHIRVYKSSYLHSELDLWLQDGSQRSVGDDAFQGQRYPNLRESRRLRSKELHYFDHPRFGAILQLIPVSTPDAALASIQGSESYSLSE